MDWLLTCSSDLKAQRRYAGWVGRSGIGSTVCVAPLARRFPPSRFDALLLAGGMDVDPAMYGARKHPKTRGVDTGRDEMEAALIARFLDAGRPVFGICRGIQILNVALGGGLIQHIPDALEKNRAHESHRGPGGADRFHSLKWRRGTLFEAALGKVREVNSAHHQAADPAALAPALRAAAFSPAGMIEAVEGAGLPAPISAVQWHPERLDFRDAASSGLLAHWKTLC